MKEYHDMEMDDKGDDCCSKVKHAGVPLLITTIVFITIAIALTVAFVILKKPKYNGKYFIEKYSMIPHIEGGHFMYGIYETNNTVDLPDRNGTRYLASVMYFLLDSHEHGKFHILKTDEIWMYHSGGELTIWLLNKTTGELNKQMLGPSPGSEVIFTVKAGTIFGEEAGQEYSLISCTCVPGYDDRDFYLYEKDELIEQYPQHKDLFTRFYS